MATQIADHECDPVMCEGLPRYEGDAPAQGETPEVEYDEECPSDSESEGGAPLWAASFADRVDETVVEDDSDPEWEDVDEDEEQAEDGDPAFCFCNAFIARAKEAVRIAEAEAEADTSDGGCFWVLVVLILDLFWILAATALLVAWMLVQLDQRSPTASR